MAELDQVWLELHDAEQRIGRVEDQLIRIAAISAARDTILAAHRATWRWLLPTIIAAVEAVAILLSTLKVV